MTSGELHGDHRCGAETCNRSRRDGAVLCDRCMQAVISMCRGKERIDSYTARKRGERTSRGWYHCTACGHFHQTRTRPGPGAHVIRARAEHAIAALVQHNGDIWFTELITSWDPAQGAARTGHTHHARPN